MKTTSLTRPSRRAFTLLEMSVVIMVLIGLMSGGIFVSQKIEEYKLGRDAAEALRTVYTAQRMYLSDFPMEQVGSLTSTKIIPYLPNNATALPTVKSLTGTQLSIIVSRYPPVVNNGAGVAYDPSGNPRDSLWDVGE